MPVPEPATYLTLPQIARELGIAESTARRWASYLSALLPSEGRGAARRFHPQAREVLAKAKALFDAGWNTSRVLEALRQQFPSTVEGHMEPVQAGQNELVRSLMEQHLQQHHVLSQAVREVAATQEQMLEKMEEISASVERLQLELRESEADRERLAEDRSRRMVEEMRRMMAGHRPWWRRILG